MGFPAPTRAVDEEEIRWYRPVRVCSPESSDVVGCLRCDVVFGGLNGLHELPSASSHHIVLLPVTIKSGPDHCAVSGGYCPCCAVALLFSFPSAHAA